MWRYLAAASASGSLLVSAIFRSQAAAQKAARQTLYANGGGSAAAPQRGEHPTVSNTQPALSTLELDGSAQAESPRGAAARVGR
jgi:hypothetical protein